MITRQPPPCGSRKRRSRCGTVGSTRRRMRPTWRWPRHNVSTRPTAARRGIGLTGSGPPRLVDRCQARPPAHRLPARRAAHGGTVRVVARQCCRAPIGHRRPEAHRADYSFRARPPPHRRQRRQPPQGSAEAAPARACTWLHRQVRPLAVELAGVWSVLGEPARAADLLRGRRDSSVGLGDDAETIEAPQLAQLYLCRRYRTTQYASSLLQLAREGTAAVRAEAWLVLLTLLGGERPEESPSDAGSWHGWWRGQDVWSLRGGQARPRRRRSPTGHLGARQRRRRSRIPGGDGSPGRVHPRPEPLATRPRGQGDEHGARLWLLTGKVGRPPLADGTFGRAALRAGEVLALRLPQAAVGLLREAGATGGGG